MVVGVAVTAVGCSHQLCECAKVRGCSHGICAHAWIHLNTRIGTNFCLMRLGYNAFQLFFLSQMETRGDLKRKRTFGALSRLCDTPLEDVFETE